MTAEDAQVIGGLGGAVAETLVKNKPVPVEMVGIHDRFLECGTMEDLALKYNLTAPALVEAVKKVIARK